MEEGKINKFFNIFSKIIFFFPILIIIFGLFIKLSESTSKIPQKNIAFPTLTPTISNNKFKLDLKTSFECSFKKDNDEIILLNKNKTILLKTIENKSIKNFLLQGDCYYSWTSGQFSGSKKCGISSLVTVAETLISLDQNTSIEELIKVIPDDALNKLSLNKQEIKKISDSCHYRNLKEEEFKLPQNILFKNEQ